jgi:hypothetical protein
MGSGGETGGEVVGVDDVVVVAAGGTAVVVGCDVAAGSVVVVGDAVVVVGGGVISGEPPPPAQAAAKTGITRRAARGRRIYTGERRARKGERPGSRRRFPVPDGDRG